MKQDITTKKGRAALALRRDPYWHKLTEGLHLGFRKMTADGGSWIARRRNEAKGYDFRSLGELASFDDAKREAERWALSTENGVTAKAPTVKEACAAYVLDITHRKSADAGKDAAGRFRRLVDDAPIGLIALDRLRTSHIEKWLHGQVDGAEADDPDDLRRAKDSANRNLASLKAALNKAMKDRLVATDAGWKTVAKYKGVGKRREAVLTPDETARLLSAMPDALRPFMSALALIPSRPGEIAALRVRDFDAKAGTLALDGKTGRRVVPVSTQAVDFLRAEVKDKLPAALIFTQANGLQWTRFEWRDGFREAATVAGFGADIVAYTLRHSAITALIAGGMTSVLVARIAGTSVEMIAKHYEHADASTLRAMLDAMPSLVHQGAA
ncbi:tyrosine-type recombinase/integrase [Paraburkholderia sp. BR13444]|uniref:tyrosine-type recombinase/integrase n=1 Tax=Paraburkholderia sp. BR13444 TaxID=3236997 RepID=UPI0034CE85A3